MNSPLPSLRRSLTPILFGGISALLTFQVRGMDVLKAANTSNLNTPASWSLGAVPGVNDVAVWTSLVTAPNSSAMGGDLSWQGIRITDVGGGRNGTNNVLITSASSANTLTIASAGIDLSSAFQGLVIQSRVTLGASQTWTVPNVNTTGNPAGLSQNEDLTFFAQAAAVPFNLGGFTVTKAGAGTVAFTSGYTISNGTFNVNEGIFHVQGGSSRVTTVNNTVTFNVANNGTLRFAAQSGVGGLTTQVNAPINLNGGSTLQLQLNQTPAMNLTGNITNTGTNTLNVFGGALTPTIFSGRLLGSGTLNYTNIHTAAGLLRMSGDNSGFTGTLALNGGSGNRSLNLASATAGSAAATWSVAASNTLQVDGVAVSLGTLNGAGTVLNSHATNPATLSVGAGAFSGVISNGTAPGVALTKVGNGTLTLTGANNYTGATNVTAGTLITTPTQTGATSVTVADGANFGVKLAAPGTAFFATSLTTGTTTGATLSFDTGNLGNPTAAVIDGVTFTPTAPTLLKVLGTNLALTNATPFPLIHYTGAIGGGTFANLSLGLPFRITGALVDNAANNRVDVAITAIGIPHWNGNVDRKWDIDTVGNGSTGTPNWLATSGPNTYVENAVNTDAVIFDESATGFTDVELTTTLSPTNVRVENTAKQYTFTGAGKISGPGALVKAGTGTLTVANSATNNYSGGTTIEAGVVRIGDGVTLGGGDIFGTITTNANGTLELNRPEDFTFSGTLLGAGTLKKSQPFTATVATAATTSGPVNLSAGKLSLASGGTLSGATAGGGELQAAGGTLELTGPDANAHTGMTTVSAGTLRLNKSAGVNAIAGDLTITGTGQLTLPASEQIPDGATITFTGTSADAVPTQVAQETVGNVIVNSSVPGVAGGQFIMRQGFTVLGTATLTSGILGVGSGNTGTVNQIVITSAPGADGIVRIAGNSAASTLNVGAGGITASGGEIQVKFNTNNQDAVLNLGGDFTATGNVAITNAGYTGASQNVINLLNGDRTFDIAAATTTTVAPAISGADDLIKTGGGTLTLNGPQNYPTLSTLAGTTILNNALGTGTSSIVSNGTTDIAVNQMLTALDIGPGGVVVFGGPFAAPAPEFFGNDDGGPGEGAVQAVPEPGGVSLLFAGVLSLLGGRRRRATFSLPPC